MPATGFEGWHSSSNSKMPLPLRVIMPATGFEGWRL